MDEPFRPYIVVRFMAAVYSRFHAQEGEGPRDLIRRGREIASHRRFRCCVVLAPDRCLYLEPDGSSQFSRQPPGGGVDLVAMRRERPPQKRGPGRLPK